MKIIRAEDSGLEPETTAAYVLLGRLPDGTICGIHRLVYHYTMHVGIAEHGHEDRYCLKTLTRAQAALVWWDGVGDPPLFHKYVGSLTGHRASFHRDVASGVVWPDLEQSPDLHTGAAKEARDANLRRWLGFVVSCADQPAITCECGREGALADAA